MDSSLIAIGLTLVAGYSGAFLALVSGVRRRRSSVVRVLAAVTMVIVLATSPGVFDSLTIATNRSRGMERVMIDPGALVTTAPGVLGLLVALSITWLWSRRQSRAGPFEDL